MKAPKKRSAQPAQPNQSLLGGLECLQALAGAERPVGSRELARLLDLEPTRANRLLGTLALSGLAERTPGGKYAPGPGLHVLAAMSLRGSRLLSKALPHLETLRTEARGFAVALGCLWRRQVAYLFFAESGARLEAAVAGRALFAAEQSSIGLALLAAKSAAELRALYRERPPAEQAAILRSVAEVRRQGWALVGGRTLGVAVGSPPVAGLALAGKPTPRVRPGLVAKLKETAEAITRDLAD